VFKYKRPLVISPHPDDLEGFTGGLVYSLRAPVISVVMSGGDKGRWQEEFEKMSPEQFMEVRLDESMEAAQILGIERILWMGYRDHGVDYSELAVQRMLNVFNYIKPDLVVSFEFRKPLSYYPHHDHINTALIVREALRRYVEAGNTADYFLTSTLGPNSFLDVSNVRRIKLEALACHTTQDALNAIIFPFFEKLSSAVWGAFNGVKYAEGYRKIDLRDLTAKPPMLPKEPVA
jgi:LmbE family N-acetylglucosaminyl deacetylase